MKMKIMKTVIADEQMQKEAATPVVLEPKPTGVPTFSKRRMKHLMKKHHKMLNKLR